jgi:hypothetical protein
MFSHSVVNEIGKFVGLIRHEDVLGSKVIAPLFLTSLLHVTTDG